MRYGSVCSGIEAASEAWRPLGWQPVFFSEIEPFPCAVLAHHHGSNLPGEPLSRNGVPNLGDMTRFEEWDDYAIDILVGGTPCQDYSIAGMRKGMAGERGGLTLTYVRILARYRPRWFVWENVPGVFSTNGGRDFARFLGDLTGRTVEVPKGGWQNHGIVTGIADAYGIAWCVRDAQYVRVDGYERAVPQRRERVFVVGYLGDWRPAAAVLLEPEGMRRDPPPCREAGQGVAGTLDAGLGTRGQPEGERGHLIANSGDVSYCVTVNGQRSNDAEVETILAQQMAPAITGNPYGDHESRGGLMVAHALRGEGFDASEDGTGRGTPIVPVAGAICKDSFSGGAGGRPEGAAAGHFLPIAFDCKGTHVQFDEDGVHPTLRSMGHSDSHQNAGGHAAVAIPYSIMPMNSGKDFKARETDVAQPLMAGGPTGGNQGGDYLAETWRVRRLTPRECNRLQGFSDDHTRIPWRGKPAGQCPDGPQYKAYGNSMAVNVMRSIGRRIDHVDAMIGGGGHV